MRRIRPFVVFAVAVGSFALIGSSLSPLSGAEGEPVRQAVGDSLGLTPQPTSLAAECKSGFFAEYTDGMGYCVDTESRSEREAWELAVRITGHVPTELEWQIYLINLEIARLSESGLTSEDPEMLELIDQLAALKAQQEQGSSSR